MKLNHKVAQISEDRACAFLKKKGFTIVARNWHCTFGEIDIIAKHKELLVFVEVKYRKSSAFGGAAYSITTSKMTKMRRTIEYYLQQFPHKGLLRADAILMEGNQSLEHIENILS